MYSIGLDIGSLNVKATVLRQGEISGYSVLPLTENLEECLQTALKQAGAEMNGTPVVATGVGAKLSGFIPRQKSSTSCLARGIHFLFPTVRTVIDMGAESTTVVSVNERGRLADWVNHDKCASGTGLFLQQMAKLMHLSLAEMSELSFQARNRADITGTCAVFAESEVISHIHRDPPTPREDIIAGIYYSVVSRTVSLCKRMGIRRDVAITGGVALNSGLVHIMEQEMGFELLKPGQPQLVAALGAAVFASEISQGEEK